MKKYPLIALSLAVLLVSALFSSCQHEDAVTLPEYSAIVLTPQQDVYHVGDKVVCEIRRLSEGSQNLRKATYWFYAGWWFTNPDMTADFQDFQEIEGGYVARSSEIELTKTGEQKLYFFVRLEYPSWDFRKIEIPLTINVVE